MPRLLILVTMVAIDWYCRPSGIMTSAAPGQLAPAYVMFVPVASFTQRPDVTWGVFGQAARRTSPSMTGDADTTPATASTVEMRILSLPCRTSLGTGRPHFIQWLRC